MGGVSTASSSKTESDRNKSKQPSGLKSRRGTNGFKRGRRPPLEGVTGSPPAMTAAPPPSGSPLTVGGSAACSRSPSWSWSGTGGGGGVELVGLVVVARSGELAAGDGEL